MKIITSCCLSMILLWLLICCNPPETPESLQSEARAETFFQAAGYNLNDPNEKYLMPDALAEISGISYYKKNVMACVQDELGTVFLYNLKDKSISKRLKFARNGDFEGISVVDNSIYAIKSNGDLFHYLVAMDSTIKIKTPLSSANDVEGLAYDSKMKRLLIACKESPALNGDKQKGKAIFSYSLNGDFNTTPAFFLNEKQINEWNQSQQTPLELSKKMKGFKPSGVAIHPKSNEIYLVAYTGKVLIVLSPGGAIRHFVPLSPNLFKQPEGICFAPNGDLYISNERKDGMANILKFDWKK